MSEKINTGQLLLEFISVVFAVTLALSLNEWRQNRKTNNLVGRVLQTLKDETISNLDIINGTIDYRRELLDNLKSGKHEYASLPISEVPFDVYDDRELKTFLRHSMIKSLDRLPESIEVIEIFTKQQRIDLSGLKGKAKLRNLSIFYVDELNPTQKSTLTNVPDLPNLKHVGGFNIELEQDAPEQWRELLDDSNYR